MTSHQAKEVLSAYRPWADATDPAFAEALALARTDDDLRRWFEEHCATQSAIRTHLKGISVPPGLKEQILSEHHVRHNTIWLRQPAMLAAAAIIAILVSLAALWNLRPVKESEDLTLTGYRNRVVRTAARTYSMDLETNSVPEIRSYLAQHQAHADFKTPATLDAAAAVGCGVLSWQGNRVSMVCFHSGRTLAAGQKTDLLLFVVDRNALPNPPPEDTPVVASIGKVLTTSWSDGDKTYVLATLENDSALHQPQ